MQHMQKGGAKGGGKKTPPMVIKGKKWDPLSGLWAILPLIRPPLFAGKLVTGLGLTRGTRWQQLLVSKKIEFGGWKWPQAVIPSFILSLKKHMPTLSDRQGLSRRSILRALGGLEVHPQGSKAGCPSWQACALRHSVESPKASVSSAAPGILKGC